MELLIDRLLVPPTILEWVVVGLLLSLFIWLCNRGER